MLDFIAKYWLQFLFSLIGTGLLVWIKHDIKMYKELSKRNKDDFKREIEDDLENRLQATRNELRQTDKEIQADLEAFHYSLENLTSGLLSVQAKSFREECHRLLEPDHIITVDEYENLVEDHRAYNSLGGNHKGDALFAAVTQKYLAQVAK